MRSRPLSHRRRALAGLVGSVMAVLLLAGSLPLTALGATTWSKNVWVPGAFLYQDPYMNQCTAAAAMMMLNTIAGQGTGGAGFAWAASTVQDDPDPANTSDMTSIFAFARKHDTLAGSGKGSDPHGWRNALNAYGWGETAMADPAQMPYVDRAYGSLKGAVKASVRAIARLGMPVGLLAWAGRHAQVMTGYIVTGEDPAVSNHFTVQAVYLSDPLVADETVNRRVSWTRLKDGVLTLRFRSYRETDSPYDDAYLDGTLAGSIPPDDGPSEWYARWVVILPVRNGVPAPTG